MTKRNTRQYDKEFKKNAVNLYLKNNRSYDSVGEELGMPDSTLASWVAAYSKDGVNAFPGKGNIKPSDAEVIDLRRKLAIACEERDILKKALGIFSSVRK